MRSAGLSLTRAAQSAGTTRETVIKHARSALRRSPGGRYTPTPSDRLVRWIWLLGDSGPIEISVRGSRQASLVARYMAAVDLYLRRGDDSALAEFRERTIRAGNARHVFLTDLAILDRLALAGYVSFDRLYVLRA